MVVFLCGTYRDLAAEREAVLGALRDMQHERQAMEFFGARPDRAIETCLEEARASDVVIVVVGFLYGSLVPGSEMSFTQTEYEEAYQLGETCLVYVRDKEAVIPAKYTEVRPSGLHRLKGFRDLVEGRHTVAKFRESADLARQVAADLNRLVDKSIRAEPLEAASARSAQALIARDLEIAADVQRELLPASALRGEGFEVTGLSVPCRYAGGDYYDFFPYSEGRIAMVIADVSGKAVSAALIMTSLRATVRTLADYGYTPAEFITRLNHSMCQNMPITRYATLFFTLLNPKDGDLIYCNAGHNPGMIAREDGSVERLSSGGEVLGFFDAKHYEQYTTRLGVGDALLLCTDGITECMNSASEVFGEDRVAAVLRHNRDHPADHICQAILDATREWAAAQVLEDDLALVAARRT
jgi:serine phosphatase RsbU (regulator of sigma subunit)